jgi:uncharacterized protein DUF4154
MAIPLVRRQFLSLCAGALAFAWVPGLGAAQPSPPQRNLEYEVKGAYLYNFLTYIEWPETAFGQPAAPFRLCLLGRDPFGKALDDLVRGESVGTHRIVIERLKEDQAVASCHAVFISDLEDERLDAIVRVTEKRSVLLVGESPRLNQLCGGIVFAVEGERVRFDINLPALTSRGLKVSAKLLRVAREASDRSGRCHR